MEIGIHKTKRGLPALWEEGGGYSNTGRAVIIAGSQGEALTPLYIRRGGHLAGREHALFVIKPGYFIIKAYQSRCDFHILIYVIQSINTEKGIAEIELKHEFDEGEWDVEPPDFLKDAISAAKKKALCYHCRSPHYYYKTNQEEG